MKEPAEEPVTTISRTFATMNSSAAWSACRTAARLLSEHRFVVRIWLLRVEPFLAATVANHHFFQDSSPHKDSSSLCL